MTLSEVFNLTKTICSQFIEINTTIEEEIKNYLSIKQNMVKPPVYNESDLLTCFANDFG